MSTRVVSFAGGVRWLAEGWRLFRVAPALWLLLAFAYWMVLLTLSRLPIVGFAMWLLHPALSLGFLALSRSCERRGRLEVGLLLEGFRVRPAAQFTLGLVYVGLLALVIGAMTLLADESVAPTVLGGRKTDAALQANELVSLLFTASVLYLPVLMLFWFAPALTAWHGMSPGQALFYSFFAAFLNWRAFLGYGLVTILITVVIPSLVLGGLLVATAGKAKIDILALVFALFIFFQPTLFASFYASYRDVFHADDGAEATTQSPG